MHNLVEEVKTNSKEAEVDLVDKEANMVAMVEVEAVSQVEAFQNNLLANYVANMATQPLIVGIGMIDSFLVRLLVLCLFLES